MIDTYIKKALLLELILQRTFEPTMPKFGYAQNHPHINKGVRRGAKHLMGRGS